MVGVGVGGGRKHAPAKRPNNIQAFARMEQTHRSRGWAVHAKQNGADAGFRIGLKHRERAAQKLRAGATRDCDEVSGLRGLGQMRGFKAQYIMPRRGKFDVFHKRGEKFASWKRTVGRI